MSCKMSLWHKIKNGVICLIWCYESFMFICSTVINQHFSFSFRLIVKPKLCMFRSIFFLDIWVLEFPSTVNYHSMPQDWIIWDIFCSYWYDMCLVCLLLFITVNNISVINVMAGSLKKVWPSIRLPKHGYQVKFFYVLGQEQTSDHPFTEYFKEICPLCHAVGIKITT